MGTNGKKIFTGIGWSVAERLSAQVISLIVSIVLARLLTPDDYGLLAIVNVFVAIGDALVAGGFGTALVQKKNSDDLDFNTLCWFSVGMSAVLYAVLYIGAPSISKFYGNDQLILATRILGLRLLFSAINSIQQAYVQKNMIFRKNFKVSTVCAVLSGTISIIMALKGAGVWALVIQNMVLVISSTVLLFAVTEWKMKLVFSRERLASMWRYGSSVFFATTVDTIKDNVRSLIVGKVFSSADLAYYNQGKRFPQLLANDVINSMGKVLLPVFSEQQDIKEENKILMRKSIRISSYILLPLILGLVGIADKFVLVFLTEKWLPCVPYLRILSLVYITRSVNTILKNSLLAVGRSDANLKHEIITSAVTIFLIVFAAFQLGNIQLIAWSYVIVSLLGTVIFSYFTKHEYGYRYKEIFSDYFPPLALSGAMCLLVVMVGKIELSAWISLVLEIAVGAGTYFALLVIFKVPELQDIYHLLIGMIKKKKEV